MFIQNYGTVAQLIQKFREEPHRHWGYCIPLEREIGCSMLSVRSHLSNMSVLRLPIRTSRVLFSVRWLVIFSELLTIFLSPSDTFWDSTVACRVVSRQRHGKHVPAATDAHATIEVLLDTVFSIRSEQKVYKEDKWSKTGRLTVGRNIRIRINQIKNEHLEGSHRSARTSPEAEE
jgi:hypothetical protein